MLLSIYIENTLLKVERLGLHIETYNGRKSCEVRLETLCLDCYSTTVLVLGVEREERGVNKVTMKLLQ